MAQNTEPLAQFEHTLDTRDMTNRIILNGLHIDQPMFEFINDEAIEGIGVNKTKFWQGLAQVASEFDRVIACCCKQGPTCSNK